jgi:hypothetical protein
VVCTTLRARLLQSSVVLSGRKEGKGCTSGELVARGWGESEVIYVRSEEMWQGGLYLGIGAFGRSEVENL